MSKLESTENAFYFEEFSTNERGNKEGKYTKWYRRAKEKYDINGNYTGFEYSKGKIQISCFYKNDVLHGPYREFDREGHSRIECEYVDGGIVGKFFSAHYDLFEYYENSDTVHKRFYGPGHLHIIFDCDEKKRTPNGSYKEYYWDGTLKKSCGYSKEGIINGPLEEFYEEGKVLRRCCYKNGVLDGDCLMHQRNGHKLMQMKYANGKHHGVHQEWFMEAPYHRKLLMKFSDGLPDGEYKQWNSEGKIIFEWEYNHSRRRNCRGYDSDGNLIVEWMDGKDGYVIIPQQKYIQQLFEQEWLKTDFTDERLDELSYIKGYEYAKLHSDIAEKFEKIKSRLHDKLTFVCDIFDRFSRSVLFETNITDVWAPCVVKRFLLPDVMAYMVISIEKFKLLLGFNSKGSIFTGIWEGRVKKIIDDDGNLYTKGVIKIARDYMLGNKNNMEATVGELISHRRGIPVFPNKEMCYSWLIIP
ncbi:MAG: hypothetical protein Hyperionvirus1_183 [Hyperionvirus sp.]|uniref:MORN repeat-containing protein n=1 Tax=Hyperionvirus sp. TaxID=2487770 RepID=A0A3G5A7W9_9VIRU|nr:MAG: hypothetical protein Hyperionvirus1_183 [Hyperionvirus sp.]